MELYSTKEFLRQINNVIEINKDRHNPDRESEARSFKAITEGSSFNVGQYEDLGGWE